METISNKLRYNLLLELKKGPKTVNELVKKLGVEQSNVSHALKYLKKCDLILSNKKGRYEIYSLQKDLFLFKKPKKRESILEIVDHHVKNSCNSKKCWKL